MTRYLEENFPDLVVSGRDLNGSQIAYARTQRLKKETVFFEHNFCEKNFPEKYDYIINRLVAHHFSENQLEKSLLNFYAGLKESGELIIIDVDGLLINLGTRNKLLQNMIVKVQKSFSGDLTISRRIPSFLKECGLNSISWLIEMMDFQNEDRIHEVEQWRERFESSIDFYRKTFGSDSKALRFMKLYLKEAAREDVPMFYNKFIIRAKKN